MIMKLPETLTPYVTLLPDSIDKFAAFGEIVRNCSVFDAVEDKDAYLEAVIEREKIQSTGIGHGVAIAHGKVAHLEKTHIALGLSRDGIFFDDIFPEPVKLVFLIASCPTKPTEYVKTLAALLSWVHEGDIRGDLEAKDFSRSECEEFLKMLMSQNFYNRK